MDIIISNASGKPIYEQIVTQIKGMIVSGTLVPGKGSFVARRNMEIIREERLRRVEELIREAAGEARSSGIALEELVEILRIYYQEG